MKSQKSKKKFGKSQNSENLKAQRLKTQKKKLWEIGELGKQGNAKTRIWMFERVEMNEGYFSKKCYKTNLYFDFFTLHHEVEAFDTCPIFIFTLAA